MRKLILVVTGGLYLMVGLYGLVPGSVALVSSSKSYNLFLIVMGLLALGAADLGGVEAKWFDFAFGVALVVLTIVAAINLVHFGTGTAGNIFLNAIGAVALLYLGLIVNHRLKQE